MKYHALLVIFEKAAKFLIVVCCTLRVISFPANSDFCHLLINFANSFYPDQRILTFDTPKMFLKEFFLKKGYF